VIRQGPQNDSVPIGSFSVMFPLSVKCTLDVISTLSITDKNIESDIKTVSIDEILEAMRFNALPHSIPSE
jgi:hypothetical protein